MHVCAVTEVLEEVQGIMLGLYDDMPHISAWHDLLICVPWFIHLRVRWLILLCAMTHAYMWHDSGVGRGTGDRVGFVWRYASYICVTWLVDMCAMIHSSACGDSLMCVPWLIIELWLRWWKRWRSMIMRDSCDMPHSSVRDMTHSYVCHDPFICVTWLIHVCAMTHSAVC